VSKSSSHPARGTLAAYEAGALSDTQAGTIDEHLRECGLCRDVLEGIRARDTEVQALRRAFEESWREWQRAGEVPVALERGAAGVADTSAGGAHGVGDPAALQAVQQPGRPVLFADTVGTAGPFGTLTEATNWLIPDYERVQLCGEGAYGSVWAVRDRVGVHRALKIIDMGRLDATRTGCRESAALETYCRQVGRHPYLIEIFHVGMVGNSLYYTMELADNDLNKAPVSDAFPARYEPLTLATVMHRRRIRPETALEITRRLLRGLIRLHQLDLVHRDIKPANVVIVQRRPKLADIGMITPRSESREVVGTPRYMPPDHVMDKSADTYALGKMLHEMICGREAPVFPALPPELRYGSLRWDLEKVSDVLVRACAAEAGKRYPSAAEMLEDLEACGDQPFHTLFDDAEGGEPARQAPALGGPNRAQVILALLRTVPWVLGFVAFALLLSRLRAWIGSWGIGD